VILYTQVDFEEEVNRLAGKNSLDVVYDAVGKSTFAKGLGLLRPRGMMALYGGASGKVEPFDPQILSTHGSIFITRPALSHYILTRKELEWRAGEVMDWVNSGKIDVRIDSTFPLAEVAAAHEALEGRRTTGKLLLIP
jgi:NADPH2:quinone reductase